MLKRRAIARLFLFLRKLKTMRRIFTTGIGIVASLLSFGQVVPNAGFETWNSVGIFEDPESWGTVNFGSAFLAGFPVTCEKTTDSHSGQYAVKLTTRAASDTTDLAPFGFDYDTVPGMLLIGSISSEDIGMGYTLRPVSAQFYYKYQPAIGDSAGAIVQLTRNVNGTQEVVGQGYMVFNSQVSTYTLGDIPIQYYNNNTPDTLTFVTFSSAYAISLFGGNNFPETGPPIPGSTLYFDDISLTGPNIPNPVNEAVAPKFSFAMYPNPAHNQLSFLSNGHQFANNPLTVEFYDMTGRRVESINVTQILQTTDISTLAPGMYIYSVSSSKGILHTGKFTVAK